MKKGLTLFVFILIYSVAVAQQGFEGTQVSGIFDDSEENRPPKQGRLDKSRIYYGGYLTMNFSRNYSVVGAQPLIAYKLTPELSFGTQLSYEYVSSKQNYSSYNGSNYGASIFSRYRVSPRFYGHGEFSLMSYKWFYTDGSNARKLAPILYLGGGFSQPVAHNAWLNTQVLFDVLNHENSPYKDWVPYISIGVGVGF